MKTLLTYDVNQKQDDVKKDLLSKGYSKTCKSSSGIDCNLPDTTVWKDNTSPTTAMADLTGITSKLGVKLERAFAVDFDTAQGIKGDAK